MNELFEFFRSEGIKSDFDVEKVINKKNSNQIVEFLESSITITKKIKNKTEVNKEIDSLSSFSINNSLAGGVQPCFVNECRLRNTYKTALFASIYPKKIYIGDLLTETYYNQDPLRDDCETKYRIIGDIKSLFILKPLFDRDIAELNNFQPIFCKNCMKKIMDRILSKIYDVLMEDIKVELIKDNFLHIISPELYEGEGSTGYAFKKLPKKLIKYKDKIPYTFDKKEILELRLLDQIFFPIIQDLIRNKYSSVKLNASFLTNIPLDEVIIKLINKIFKKKNINILDNFEMALPIINGDINKILKFRESNDLSFGIFSNSLRKVFDEVKNDKNIVKIDEVINETITPKLQKIQRSFNVNRKILLSSAAKEFALGFMLISPRLFFGKDFSNLFGIAEIGIGSCIMDLLRALNEPKEIMTDEYYFLWKAQKECSR